MVMEVGIQARAEPEANGLVDGYAFWTFTDIFEENYFPSVPFHGGFGLLNLHGIPKPTYRAYELFHRLGPTCWWWTAATKRCTRGPSKKGKAR